MLEGGKVLQVLARVYEPLSYAIQNPSSIPVGNYPYPYMRATRVAPVKMHSDELDAWNQTFDITGKALAARKGIVAVDTNIPLTELDRVSYQAIMDRAKKKDAKMPRPDLSDCVLYGGTYCKFFPFEVDGIEFYIQPHAIMETTRDWNNLQIASLQLRFFAMDRDGRLAVAVPRPVRHGFPAYSDNPILSGAIVVPYEPIDVRLLFNTTLDPNGQNKLWIELSNHYKLRMRAELHDREKINQTQVPSDDRIEVFFGQIARFLAPMKEGNRTIDNLFQTEGRV